MTRFVFVTGVVVSSLGKSIAAAKQVSGGAPVIYDDVVLGPGHLIGEMGVLDGAPRSTNCAAVSRVEVGALTRASLHKLIDDHPTVGARLMAAVAHHLADRFRAVDEQLRRYGQMAGKLQREIDRLTK